MKPSGFPVDAKVTLPVNGVNETKTNFYVRINNGTHEFKNEEEKQKFIAQRWPGN